MSVTQSTAAAAVCGLLRYIYDGLLTTGLQLHWPCITVMWFPCGLKGLRQGDYHVAPLPAFCSKAWGFD